MSIQKDHLDLQQGGDTGQNNVDSVQPVTDGEGATQTVLRRPSENLRGRTEEIRTLARDLVYYRDHNHLVIEGATGHTLTWPGSTTAAGTGIIAQVGDLTIRPLLTPDTSLKGLVGFGTTAVDRVVYTVASGAFSTHGMNAVTIEHRDTAGATPHQATITTGPIKRILVEFDSGNGAHNSAATKILVDAAIVADPDLTGPLIDVTDDGGAVPIVVGTETRIEGTADQEAHRIPSTLLDTLTTAEPLAEGDAIGIWYRHVIEPGGAAGDPLDPKGGIFGGRQESNPDRATSTIPIASLFVTSNDPSKIPGAVPLCKVVNNELVWFDGSRFVSGSSGPIGTSVNLYIDDTNFTGAKTNISAGGIDNPLSPASAQQALDNVDTRLAQLRAFSYVCTDGTASTGGDFNGSTALQLAISQLAGAGGTIYLRRGIYDVPAAYGYASNVRIVGEHKTLVTIQPTVLSNQFLASGMQFENVTLGTNFLNTLINAPQDNVQFVDCIFTGDASSQLTIAANGATFENVTWTTDYTTANDTAVNTLGDDNSFKNCSFPGGVSFTGNRNSLDNCEIRHIHDGRALVVSGSDHTLRDVRINKTAGTTGAFGTLINITGANTLVDGLTVDTTVSAIPATDSVMQMISNGGNQHFKRVFINAGDHMALEYASAADNEAYYESCVFKNMSTTVDTFATTGVIGDYVFARFDNCVFDDNSQLGNSVANLAFLADDNAHRWQFHNCQFKAATFNNTPCGRFRHANFYGCTFLFQNINIPGQDESALDGLWRFEGVTSAAAGADDGRCVVQDCTFDFNDAEVIDDAVSDPIFLGAYVAITDGDLINPQFLKLSRYGDRAAATPGGSVVRLNNRARLDRATFDWTATAFIQAGSGPSDQGWIRVVGNYVTIQNVELINVTPAAFTHAVIHVGVDSVACVSLTMRDCAFIDANGSASQTHFRATTPTGTGNNNWLWHNVNLGDATSPLTLATGLPVGRGCTISACRFIFADASNLSDLNLGAVSTGGGGVKFIGNLLLSTVATDGSAKGPINVTGVNLSDMVFCNNTIIYSDSGANTRDLFSGAPAAAASVVAVGNVYLNEGAGVGTADGSITINTPNVGLP